MSLSSVKVVSTNWTRKGDKRRTSYRQVYNAICCYIQERHEPRKKLCVDERNPDIMRRDVMVCSQSKPINVVTIVMYTRKPATPKQLPHPHRYISSPFCFLFANAQKNAHHLHMCRHLYTESTPERRPMDRFLISNSHILLHLLQRSPTLQIHTLQLPFRRRSTCCPAKTGHRSRPWPEALGKSRGARRQQHASRSWVAPQMPPYGTFAQGRSGWC